MLLEPVGGCDASNLLLAVLVVGDREGLIVGVCRVGLRFRRLVGRGLVQVFVGADDLPAIIEQALKSLEESGALADLAKRRRSVAIAAASLEAEVDGLDGRFLETGGDVLCADARGATKAVDPPRIARVRPG